MKLTNQHFLYKSIFLLIFATSLISCSSNKKLKSTNSENKTTTTSISQKYSKLLSVSENDISNLKLYTLLNEWENTPYKYGGKDKSGVDCSNFAAIIYKTVYNKNISGSAASIYNQCITINKDELTEGDLLFFKIENDNITHIGVFLMNNKFVHATTQKGVMINDLNDAYYKKYYYKAGRLE